MVRNIIDMRTNVIHTKEEYEYIIEAYLRITFYFAGYTE